MEGGSWMMGIDLLAAGTEYLCAMLVMSAFFARRNRNKWIQLGAVLLCGFVHICLSMFTNSWPMALRSAFIWANCFLVCEICYCGSTWKRILIILLFWAVAFAIDMSVLTVCMAVMGRSAKTALSPSTGYLISMLIARTLLLSVCFACDHIVRRQHRKQERNGVIWVCLLLIPLYTIIAISAIFSNAMEGGALSGNAVVLSGGLLCVNILLCLVVNKLEQNRLMEKEKKQLQAEAAHNLELAKMYQDSFKQQRKITHEFHNQLDAMGNLLAQGEHSRALDYVRHLQATAQEVVPFIRTNHPMVDAILNQKYQQAAKEGIGMRIDCNDLSAIPLEDGDLVTLLGNILDNAILASTQTEEKQILLRLWQAQGVYQLIVRNSCQSHRVESTKQARMLHGFGLELVCAVLEKYGYPYFFDQIDNLYVFSAVLG